MAQPIIYPENTSQISCVDASSTLINEIKTITTNLKSKKIFDPVLYSSYETVRALHYIKHEVQSYFRQYEDIFKKYKTSLENIKEFAKEIANIEKKNHFFYPYRHVKEKYERLIKEHENCEKKLNPILIKFIMNKQEYIVEKLLQSSFIDIISVPRIDSSLLLDPPFKDDVDRACELYRGPSSYLDDDTPMKYVVRKIFKRGIEVACEPLEIFEKNMSILTELKRFDDSRNILKFYGISTMTYYMEPKITNFYLAKHASDISPDNDDHISEYISQIINWAAPEMMQDNPLYTRESELGFQRIPYKDMEEKDIRVHVVQNRRESPDPPFYSLDFLNIQRKYLRIIAEGWNGKPEKRIKMDDILLRFLDIETELTKPKRNNSTCSAHSADQLDQLSSPRNHTYMTQSPTSLSFPENDEQQFIPTQTPRSSSINSNWSVNSTTSDDIYETAASTLNNQASIYMNEPSIDTSNFKSFVSPNSITKRETYRIPEESDETINEVDDLINKVNESNQFKSSNIIDSSIIKVIPHLPDDDNTKSLINDDNTNSLIIKDDNTNLTPPLIKDDMNSLIIKGDNTNLTPPPLIKDHNTNPPSPLIKDDNTKPFVKPSIKPSLEPLDEPLGEDDDMKSLCEDDDMKPLEPSESLDDNFPSDNEMPSDKSDKSDSFGNKDFEDIRSEEDLQSDNDEPSDNESGNPSEKPNSPIIKIPETISKNLAFALTIKSQKLQFLDILPCALPKPRIKAIDTKFQTKLSLSSKSKDSFLLENSIGSLAIDLDNLNWASKIDIDSLINKSQVNDIYLEIKCLKAELIFEKGSMKPSEIFLGAIDNAFDQKNPYRELIKVFNQFGHFLPRKILLGDKLSLISKIPSTSQKSTEVKIIKEIKTIDDFSKKTGDYNEIIKQWAKLTKSTNIDSLSLNTINGKSIKGNNNIKEWAIACLKNGPESWNIIGWEGLYPIYEILDEDVCQDVKVFLGIDEQTINTGIKEKVLKSGIIVIEDSNYIYPVNFESPLESNNYQIFGRILLQTGAPFDNANVKFISKETTGFSAIIDIFSPPSNGLQITWVLIGIPAEIGVYDSNTRNFSILSGGKCQFTPKTKETGIESCDVQLKTREVLQPNAVLITSFKYPKSNYKQYFMAKVKGCHEKTINVNISVKKNENDSINEDDNDENYSETPELCWYVALIEDDELGEIGQSVHTNHLRSSTENNDLDFSYKKLDTETGKLMLKVLKENKTINSLDISENNISPALGKALMKVLETNNTLTFLNLSSTNLEPEITVFLMKILRSNKTRLTDLNLSKNGEKLGKKARLIIETLGKNTTLKTLNLSENPIEWADVKFVHLEGNRTLENLDLSNSNLNHVYLEKMKRYLSRSKKLKVLNLSSNNLTYQSERIIAEVLATNKTLKSLNLSCNKISSTLDSLEREGRISITGRYSYDRNSALKVNNLAKALEKNKTLKKLDLGSNYIRLEAGKSIAKALTMNKFINELSLSDNGIVSELKDLLINILTNSNITSINLKSTKISSDMVISLSVLLRSNKTKLRCLNLSRNEISSEAIGSLIEALEENTHLRSLDLSNITSAGQIGRELAKSLETNRTLKCLNLSNCNIRAVAVSALAKALQTNFILSDLDLSNNGASMSPLLKTLETNKALTRLNLNDIDFNSDEIESLANALKTNNALTHLYLSKIIMYEPENGKVLFEALGLNKKLTDLDLSRNNFGSELSSVISSALFDNKTLRRLDLTSNQFDQDAKNEIKKALKSKTLHLNIRF
ncbi:22788_t:CDS:2 [Cetraspora pellucida]|uniref:22788_t:CDS:1 n=1 Tax=Cetraspora pellucida TaxID=1433469 RepID=A0A9N9GKS8_9GLOM|nr:22788_t:CDS:2 [Cetraspora pellucida]